MLEYSSVKILSPCEEFSASIGFPYESDMGDFACDVSLVGLGLNVNKSVFGVSPHQAISLSIHFVGSLVLQSKEYEAGRIMWSADGRTYEPIEAAFLGIRSDAGD